MIGSGGVDVRVLLAAVALVGLVAWVPARRLLEREGRAPRGAGLPLAASLLSLSVVVAFYALAAHDRARLGAWPRSDGTILLNPTYAGSDYPLAAMLIGFGLLLALASPGVVLAAVDAVRGRGAPVGRRAALFAAAYALLWSSLLVDPGGLWVGWFLT